MATEASISCSTLHSKKSAHSRLLRKPLAPVVIPTVPLDPSTSPSKTLTYQDNNSPSYLGYEASVCSDLPISPPPPSQYDALSEHSLSHPSTKKTVLSNIRNNIPSRPRFVKSELKYILDPNYRERTALGTYVEGQSLVKPYKPRGPSGMPLRLPHQRHNPPALTMGIDEEDLRYIKPPEFTLQDFLVTVSENERVPLEKARQIVFSKHNYKQLQKIICGQFLHPPSQVHMSRVNMKLPDEVKKATPRIPQKQLLFEMAVLVKEQMSDMMSMDMKSAIRPLPRYSPNYKPGHATPHTEIVLYEDNRKQTEAIQTSQKRDSEIPGKDSIFHGATGRYFQGTARNNSPFASADEGIISPSELAVLDSLVNGGSALSLKAHFISQLPDIDPLSKAISYLNLSFNDIRVFPIEITTMVQLKVLKMRNNPLKEIPPEISRLRELRTFVFSFCLVSSLPLGLFELRKLAHLDMAYNKILFLPNEIKRLKRLRELNLEGNQLVAMPAGSLRLPEVRYLRVRNNFMHPLFWKENTQLVPQRLLDMTALIFKQYNLQQCYTELPDNLARIISSYSKCDCCHGPLYGPGLRIIRPVSKIFGIKNLPFLFRCCSPYCSQLFSSNSETLMDVLYGKETGNYSS